ncbi:MAG: hypothetical protein FRX48_05998 [Lasallia pustulata]|uniref:Rhodopsin domain-containing protein n=1 Tax=Lasallia pustulata TaxID=136370 RepID=A0A5M8PNT4_9LECA|nr:MAG: hypothetical protein FRX48_05998 [Lasallia pustulata]
MSLQLCCSSLIYSEKNPEDSGHNLWWDDLLIIVVLLFEYGLSTTILWATVAFHFGRNVEGATESQVIGFLKSLMTVQMTYHCAQAAVKSSLLMPY